MVENIVYIQVANQVNPKFPQDGFTQNGKQTRNTRLVARGF